MRVLHVITGLQRSAGTSVFCREICDGLMRAGHEVVIAVCDSAALDTYPSRNGVPLVSIRSGFSEGDVLKSVEHFDLVHIHALWHPALHRAARWAYRNRVPVVWSPHGMLAPWAMSHKRWKKWLPWHLYQKSDLRETTLFHATSEVEREWIAGFGFESPCVVVPLGTELPRMETRPERGAWRNILFVGRIYPVKNLDSLIRAFARVHSEFIGWRLLLVGPDQSGHREELIAIARACGLSVEVQSMFTQDSEVDLVFTGALFDSEKEAVYRSADLFVLPSHSENFGGVVADALAYGVPCIVSDRTPWAELETEGCGLWIDNGVGSLESALRHMMELPDSERESMGRRGRALAERKYTWDVAVQLLLRGYEAALGSVSDETHRTEKRKYEA